PRGGGGGAALDAEVIEHHAGRAPDGAELHAGLDLGLLEPGVEPVQRALVDVVGPELQRGRSAGALVLVVEAVELAATEYLQVGSTGNRRDVLLQHRVPTFRR